MKKLPPKEGREIFSEKLGQLVQLQGHAALLAGSSVLVQKTLQGSLVNRLDSNLVSNLSGSLVAGDHSGVELLQVGLQLRLVSLVLLVSDLGRDNVLLGRLNVGHWWHSFPGNFIQVHIIAPLSSKINPYFYFFVIFLRVREIAVWRRSRNAEFKMLNAELWCASGTILKYSRREYIHFAFSILHSAFALCNTSVKS